ncbi:MAG: polysaccharide biosynthesis/export family protein [Nitrospiraceae bacterium]|nr:polysaccharide biosynthesis/export family protein [Nitrospiraceae bacterium]
MRPKNFVFSLSLLLVLSVVACGVASAGQYTIGDGDVLSVSVWGNSNLNVSVPVRPDGMISVPLVGDVRAAGATPGQLKSLLEKQYAGYVKNPVVSVIVTEINSFVVYVFGDGTSQPAVAGAAPGSTSGAFTLKRDTTLLQLLSKMGSLANADLKSARVIRDGKKLSVDFYKLFVGGDVSQDIELKPDDFIYIPSNFESRIRVVGAVKTPCTLPFEENMTALDAVLSAGGFTDYASGNSVIIERKEGSVIKDLKVRLKDVMNGDISKNVPLKPGDIVIVKTGIF